MTNRTTDLVPQGSIPQVLDKAEQVLSDLSFHYVQWHGIDTPVEQSRRHMLLVAADSIRQLLTALRSLPPVPMQQVVDKEAAAIERLRDLGNRLIAEQRSPADVRVIADVVGGFFRIRAALRSLASPQAEQTKEND